MITAVNPILLESVGADAQASSGSVSARPTVAMLPYSAPEDTRGPAPSMSGVILDEDVMNQIRSQNSYTAVAKMITTTDGMIRAVLGITL